MSVIWYKVRRKAITLVFLCEMSTSGITWSPQYFLDVLSDDGQHSFQAFADVVNQTKQEFYINRTELISGEAVLGIANNSKYGFRRRRSRSESILSESSLILDEGDEHLGVAIRGMPAIDSLPEIGGEYRTYYCKISPAFFHSAFYHHYRPIFLCNRSSVQSSGEIHIFLTF